MLTVAPLASGQANYYLSLAATAAGYYVDEKGLEPAGVWYGPWCRRVRPLGRRPGRPPEPPLRRRRPPRPRARISSGTPAPRSGPTAPTFVSRPPRASAWPGPWPRPSCGRPSRRRCTGPSGMPSTTSRTSAGCPRRGPGAASSSPSRSCSPSSSIPARGPVTPNCTSTASAPTSRGTRNGRTTAIDPTGFYDHMMAGGAVFRASLAEGLRELGL